MRRFLRRTIGALFWGALLAALAGFFLEDEGRTGTWLRELRRYFTQDEGHVTVEFPGSALVEVGAEVRLEGDEGVPGSSPVGEVEALLDDAGGPMPWLYAWCRSVRVRVFDRRAVPLRSDAGARLVLTPQTAPWVVQTLLTQENLPRLAAEWNQTMLEHREEIFDLLTPIVRDILIDVERHVEGELPGFVARHRDEIRALGEDLKQDFLQREFAGFFEKKLWPIAEPRIRPVITEISREIFREFPVWGLSWRLAYQALPFTSNDHVEKAWRAFVSEKVVPILRAHSDEVTEATRAIAKEVFSRQEISSSIRGTFEALMENPRFHALTQTFLREVFLDNYEFQEMMRRRWKSPVVQRALEVTTAYLEPTVRRMGDIVFGTREEGITPEFTRVLRAQILLKDLQKIVLRPGSEAAGPLAEGARLRASVEWDFRKKGRGGSGPEAGAPGPAPQTRGGS